MTKINVVTTCNKAGWKQYGRRMATNFVQYWPADTTLKLYAEGFDPGIRDVEVCRLPDWLNEFKERQADNPDAHGLRLGTKYNYRRDCVRFAHKVAAFTDVGLQLSDGILIWIDADTAAHRTIDKAWLLKLLPDGNYMSWLERTGTYPECGFLIFRCGHNAHRIFMERLMATYQTDRVFDYPQTHDSFVIQQVVLKMVSDGIMLPPFNLSGRSADRRQRGHPFVQGVLGERLDHLKGARKTLGRSPELRQH